MATSIATAGWLDLSETLILKNYLKSGMMAIDVGANIGSYTPLFSKKVGPAGLVLF
ncbi:MAG TPA: hypothetical protein VJN71_02970 [Nitrososphaerales archaeon]|nr:hypothetical protein [Nitrososphaerales archaeon]